MNCSKCGYAMDAWDTVCPKCQGKGLAQTAPAAAAPQNATGANTPGSVVQQKAPPRSASVATEEDDEDTWWQSIGAGLFFLALGGFFYWYFTDLETSGGVRRIKWFIAIAYNIGGKWPIIVICELIGLAGIIFGISDFFKRRSKA